MNKAVGLFVVAIGIFVYFYAYIPVTFVHSAHFFWAFVGCILSGICLFFIGYQKQKDLYDIDSYKKSKGKQTAGAFAGMLVLICGIVPLNIKFIEREKEFIEENPVLVEAKVVSGISKKSRNGISYKINVNYNDSKGKPYRTDADISSTEWSTTGVGMLVSVVYEKNNPSICKVILKAKDAMEYMSRETKIFPTLKDLQIFLRTDDYNEQNKLLGQYWTVQKKESSDGVIEFTNSITKDNIGTINLVNIYMNADENDFPYNEILKEARANMKVVYDYFGTNPKAGVLLENDSMQIRFQTFDVDIETQPGGIKSLLPPPQRKVYCFGFTKNTSAANIILPGDLQPEKEPKKDFPNKVRDFYRK